jgi:hypothetical protein
VLLGEYLDLGIGGELHELQHRDPSIVELLDLVRLLKGPLDHADLLEECIVDAVV